jgi:hypothetical protein
LKYKCFQLIWCYFKNFSDSYIFNCDYSLHTPTKQIFSSYFEMCWYCIIFIQKSTSLLWKWTHWQYLNLYPYVTLAISTKGNLHYENNRKDNTYIKMANLSLETLWDEQYPHISQRKGIVSYVICEILCNMIKLVH